MNDNDNIYCNLMCRFFSIIMYSKLTVCNISELSYLSTVHVKSQNLESDVSMGEKPHDILPSSHELSKLAVVIHSERPTIQFNPILYFRHNFGP